MRQDQEVLQALEDHSANAVILDFKETQEPKAKLDPKDHLELQVMMAKQVLTVIGVLPVLQDLLARVDREVLKVCLDDLELLVTRGTKVTVEQQELKVQQARMEQRERQVLQAEMVT